MDFPSLINEARNHEDTGKWKYSSTILNVGSRWKWMVSFTPGKGPQYPLDRRLCGTQSRSGPYRWDTHFCPAGNRIPAVTVPTSSGVRPTSSPMGTGGSFPGGKAAGAWTWPLTSNQCRSQENVDLYTHSHIRLHSVVLALGQFYFYSIDESTLGLPWEREYIHPIH
jgi:hypothetical protein